MASIGGALSKYEFVCAFDGAPYLAYVDRRGGWLGLPQDRVVGRVGFPKTSESGWLAYIATSAGRSSADWLNVLVLVDPEGLLYDIVPAAAPYAPPCWSPDGRSLAYVNADASSTIRRAMLVNLVGAGEQIAIFERENLRSVAWIDDTSLVFSARAEIVLLDIGSGREELIYRHASADAFLRWGTDDFFATIDQIAVSPTGTIAFVLRWRAQGKPWRDELFLFDRGAVPQRVDASRVLRTPSWSKGGTLGVSTPGNIVIAPGSADEYRIRVSGLHSCDWQRRSAVTQS
jgi:hypothetical protein